MAHTFTQSDRFYLDGRPFQIRSGAIHYFRVVPAYWRDRLEKLKAMGCNTVETYIPWNLHEPKPGVYDFSGGRDVAAFLKLAQELGLWAIVRPGPYICAEWDLGGLPSWLLTEDGMRLRCTYPPFLRAVRRYFARLLQVLAPLQIDRGGNILMMQVENEYGSYGDEHAYLEALRDLLRENGVTVPLFTSDGPLPRSLANGSVEGALPTVNFGAGAPEKFAVLQAFLAQTRGEAPLLCTEFWVGWFDAWGDRAHNTTPPDVCAREVEAVLKRGSINLYLFHGGTNFGLLNGANDYGALSPDTTSYDYDAPLAEDGSMTPKYNALRALFARFAEEPLPAPPPPIPKRAFGTVSVTDCVSLEAALSSLGEPVRSPWPLCMEKLGQSVGYVLYSTQVAPHGTYRTIELQHTADRAQLFFDGRPAMTLYDRELHAPHDVCLPLQHRLSILVENLGRVNYGPLLAYQRKGIDGAVLLDGRSHAGWEMIPLPMDAAMASRLDFSAGFTPGLPAFYRFRFSIEAPADTFLDLAGWGKGCVLVNGFLLGRFWDKGPQSRLYVPAPLLRAGENEVLLFETEGRACGRIAFCDSPGWREGPKEA